MVYVSCNVSTLAKDLVVLANYYKVEYIQSVDMFPHTARTEAVVKLTKRDEPLKIVKFEHLEEERKAEAFAKGKNVDVVRKNMVNTEKFTDRMAIWL